MSSILQNGRDRQTPRRELGLFPVLVKANTVIRAGFIVVTDATGFATEGKAGAGLTYLGRAEEAIDNTSGADGDVQVLVRSHNAFFYENSSTDPVTQASFGKDCFIEDAETVAATDNAGALSKAGRVVGIEDNGVWVE